MTGSSARHVVTVVALPALFSESASRFPPRLVPLPILPTRRHLTGGDIELIPCVDGGDGDDQCSQMPARHEAGQPPPPRSRRVSRSVKAPARVLSIRRHCRPHSDPGVTSHPRHGASQRPVQKAATGHANALNATELPRSAESQKHHYDSAATMAHGFGSAVRDLNVRHPTYRILVGF